mgnify:CR=1 FL=1
MEIGKISSTVGQALSQTSGAAQGATDPAQEFGKILQSLNDSQQQSDELMSKLAAGENVDVHDAMITLQENDVNFRVAMAIRDHLVDAYRQMMNMSV